MSELLRVQNIMDAINDKNIKRQTGSFYSPSVLAHYLASKIQSVVNSNTGRLILDPAVGDGELLLALKSIRNCPNDTFVGIDIDKDAITASIKRLPKTSFLINTNALSPYGKNREGWDKIKALTGQEYFDIIISNPPWGAFIDGSRIELSQFNSAQGQYDIFDLFVETSIDLLREGGVYGFILPDALFRKEHHIIREKLLKETNINYVIRVGEFFFEGVNTPVTLIIGTKKHESDNVVLCMNLSNSDSKKIISGDLSFDYIEKIGFHQRKQESFISDSCNLSIDIMSKDEKLVSQLESKPKLRKIMTSHRGVELSKKGNVIKCPSCGKWMPKPISNKLTAICPCCKVKFEIGEALQDKIISIAQENNLDFSDYAFVAGEDMGRYEFKVSRRIKLNYDGINYKPISLYTNPKIIVRKTGVGITACLDYGNNVVNQVVYILNVNNEYREVVPLEFCIALLNSRLITYYIIKKYGSTKWCTHPYLSQDMVMSLPIPDIAKFTKNDWNKVAEIAHLVSEIYRLHGGIISNSVDAQIEKLIFELFKLDKRDYDIVLSTIKNVEQLIPFKRLLNIPEDIWDTAI